MKIYYKTVRLFLTFILSSLIYAEERTFPIVNDDNSYVYTWNSLGEGGTYPPLISADMNTSAYDWNALNTKWVNMRIASIGALDLSHFYQDINSLKHIGNMDRYNRVDVRGIRFGLLGTINFDKPWTYVGMVSLNSLAKDFDSAIIDRFSLYDAMIGIPIWGEYGRMQIGKMKAPISMERIMGMVFEQAMERPTHLDALLDSRSIGIDFSDMIFNQRFTWKIGVFNNWLEEENFSFSKANQEVVGRITAVAYENADKERLLHLGAAFRYVDIREGSVSYSVGPEQWFVNPWVDTGDFNADSSHTINMELTYLDGPLWFASEYTITSVDSAEFNNPTFSGYHVTANYFLTGEHRGYNKRKGTVRRITPILDFTNGGLGAVEVSARYSSLDLADGKIEGGEIDISSIGLIWHPRHDTQFHMQWSRTHLEKDISPTKSKSDIVQCRIVVVLD